MHEPEEQPPKTSPSQPSSDRAFADEAARDAPPQHQSLPIDRLPLAYVRYDANLRVLEWNWAAEAMFGYTRDEIVGEDFLSRILPRPAEAWVNDIVRRLQAGDMQAHSVNENRTRDGRVITCEWFNTPLTDPHEKGAFTDAREMKRGMFEIADHGTLFLDEIGDLAQDLQPKLLKVLETKRFRRLGGTREIEVDVRLLAATHRDLGAEARAGRFREDLFYRLSVFPLTIPPLRERSREDVLELVHASVRDLHRRHPDSPRELSAKALDLLVGYAWPGNVRELRNAVERALVMARGAERVGPEHLPEQLRAPGAPRAQRQDWEVLTLEEMERRHIERTLLLTTGNRTLAARKLGTSRATLHAKIKEYGLQDVGRR